LSSGLGSSSSSYVVVWVNLLVRQGGARPLISHRKYSVVDELMVFPHYEPRLVASFFRFAKWFEFSRFSNLIFTEIEKYVFRICNWIYNFVLQKIWKFFTSLDHLRMSRFKKLKQKRIVIKYLFDILIVNISDRLTELISDYVAHMHMLHHRFFISSKLSLWMNLCNGALWNRGCNTRSKNTFEINRRNYGLRK